MKKCHFLGFLFCDVEVTVQPRATEVGNAATTTEMLRWLRLVLSAVLLLSCLFYLAARQGTLEDLEPLIKQFHVRQGTSGNEFIALDGQKFTLKTPRIWNRRLYNELCILDVNTDPMTGPNSAWSRTQFHWPSAKQAAAGVLNHFLYGELMSIVVLLRRKNQLCGQRKSMATDTCSCMLQ